MSPTSQDGWDYCETKIQMPNRPTKRMLIPFKQDFVFVATGRRLAGLFIVACSPTFPVKNWNMFYETDFVENPTFADRVHTRLAADNLMLVERELLDQGWEQIGHGPYWYRGRFRRRQEQPLTLGQVLETYCTRPGRDASDFDRALGILHVFERDGHAGQHRADGMTPLHLVASWGMAELAMMLLDNGAQVEAKDKVGVIPPYIAEELGHRRLLQLFGWIADLQRDGFSMAPGQSYCRFLELKTNNDWTDYADPFWIERDGT